MNNERQDVVNHQSREHATHHPTTRMTASLSPEQLLMRMENIHRLGKKDVPRQ